jgi:hypothetical protein
MVSVCEKLESYADGIVKSCVSDLAAAEHTESLSPTDSVDSLGKRSCKSAVQFTATRTLCVRVNNFLSLMDQMVGCL